MGRYVRALLLRLGQFFVSLMILILISFGLIRFFPGSPFNEEKNLDPQIQENLKAFYGLNESLLDQFMNYLKRIFTGDLGSSMHFVGRSVNSLIWEYGKTSVLIGLMAFTLAVLISFLYLFATRSKLKSNSAADFALMGIISIPTLALAPFCIWLFGFQLEWFPIALLERPQSYVLPVLLLSLKPALSLSRVLSSSTDLVLQEKYIQTAKSLGFTNSQILFKWALKNSLTSFFSQSAPLFASLISGSFLIEVLFAIPGLGFHFVESVLNRDWPLILGLTLTYGILLMLSQLIADFLIVLLDPQARTL